MTRGQRPADVELDPALFPAAYRQHHRPESAVTEADPAGSAAPGPPELAELDVYHGVVALYAITGHASWAGRRLGDHLQGDAWQVWSPDPRPYEDLAVIGRALIAHPELALAFFNHLGPAGTARLADLAPLRGDRKQEEADRAATGYRQTADALGLAASSGALAFTGRELIEGYDSYGRPVHPAHLILVSTTIPDRFLFDAAVAAINDDQPMWSRPINPDRMVRSDGATALAEPVNSIPHTAELLTMAVAGRDLPAVLSVLRAADNAGQAVNAGHTDQWTDLLVALTHPAATGDAELSAEAARWIVGAAGGDDTPLSRPTAPALDRILAGRPGMLVQGASAELQLQAAGVDPSFATTYLGLGRETTSRAVRKVFEAGEGLYLTTLQDTLIPWLTAEALTGSRIPPDPGAASAYGQIDATITAAHFWVGRSHARTVDARNAFYRSLLDSTAGAIGGQAYAPFDIALRGIDSFVIDQGVGQGMNLLPFLPTDNEMIFLQDSHRSEAAYTMGSNHQVITTLADKGVLGELDPEALEDGRIVVVPVSRTELDAMIEDLEEQSISWDLLLVVDEQGQPILEPGEAGSPVPTVSEVGRTYITATDWQASLTGFRDTRSSELALHGLDEGGDR